MATLFGALALGAFAQSDAVEREARIRVLALGDGGQGERLDALLVSDSWAERLVALEAIARSETGGVLEMVLDQVRACLDHPQPNVRAGAIRALVSGGGAESETFQAEMMGLAKDMHPLVRTAAARCGLPTVLAELVEDGDPMVRAVAHWHLMTAGPGAWREQRDAVLWGAVELADALEPLSLGGVSPELALALRASDHPDQILIEGLCVSAGLDPLMPVLLGEFCAGIDHQRVLKQRRQLAQLLGEREDLTLAKTLGLGLFEQAEAMDLDAEASLELLLEGAALCLPPKQAASVGQALDDERALIFWQTLGGRKYRWRAADLEPWLFSDRNAALRFDIALFASGQLNGPHAKEWVTLFLELVQGPAPSLRLAAFRWLSDVELDPDQEQALRDRWARLPAGARRERLRDLPRGRALPAFRADFLKLLTDEPTDASGAIELLGRFRGDAGVSEVLEEELARALGVVEGAEDTDRRRAEATATDLLQALARVNPEGSRELTRRGLQIASKNHPSTRHELGKAALAVLARGGDGRADLLGVMELGNPPRLRFEAALQGVRWQAELEPFRSTLVELFDSVDRVLQLRAVRALGRLKEVSLGGDFVRWIADPAGQQEVQVAAIEALGQCKDLEALAPLLQLASPDLRLAVVDQLCNLEGAEELLRRELEARLADGVAMPANPFEGSELLDLLRALACGGPVPQEWLGLILERPMAQAASYMTLRFRGESLPGTLSNWRPELEAFRALANNGQAPAVLAAAGEWWRLDARLLYELAHFAARDKNTSARLLSAARVALAGEQNPRSSLQVRWLRAGPGAGDPAVIERHLGRALRGLSQSQRGRLGR